MIRDITYWNQWEEDLQRRTPVDIEQNFRLMDAMYQEARQLGIHERLNPWMGLKRSFFMPRPSMFQAYSPSCLKP